MALKTYQVNGPEGIIEVQGPEGASDAEVQAQAKRLYAVQQDAKVAALRKNTPPPVSVAQAAAAPTKMGAVPQGIVSTLWNAGKHGIEGNTPQALQDVLQYFTRNTLNDKLADLGNVTRDAASAVTGTAAGIATANPLIGSAAGATMDQALRSSTGQGTGEEDSLLPTDNPVLATLKNTALNEVGGRIIGGVARGVGKALGQDVPIKRMTDELANLKPTYGQVTGRERIENMFAPAAKKASVTASTTAADSRIKDIVGELTSRDTSGGKVTNVFAGAPQTYTGPGPANSRLAEVMQAEVKQGFKNAVEASNVEAKNFLSIAETNQTLIPQPPQIVNTGMLDQFGQPITKSVPVAPKVISGAVHLDDTLDLAAQIAQDMHSSKVPPDPENPVLRAIDGLFNGTGATLDDATGKVVSHEPISAGDAWKTKQALDKLAYGDPVEGLNAGDSKLKELSKALNRDIDNAIPKWQNGAVSAQNSWEDAKAIVQKRHEIFSPMGETGAGTKTLLNTVNAPDDAIEAIYNDSKKMQRFFETGNMTVNGRQIVSSNAKRDMQGYAINRIWDNGFTQTDPLNHTIGTANGAKMATEWTELANSDKGKELFSKQQIQNYNEFFDAVRKTTATPGTFTKYITLNFGTRAVALASAVLAGSATSVGSAGVVGGAVSLSVVARVMASKKWAPVMLAMMHGEPLGMSFQAASRGIMQAMSGGAMELQNADGTSTSAIVGTDGVPRPVKNSLDANEQAYRKSIGR